MDTAVVFTSKYLNVMFKEGGSGHWKANGARLSKCKYVIATKSNKLREHFSSNLAIKEHAAFLIGKVSGVKKAPNSDRYVIQMSEYAEVNIPDVWKGNRNPVAYENMHELEQLHGFSIEKLDWKDFPIEEETEEQNIKPLTIQEAKEGLAIALGIKPDNVEILIKA